jgi:hypothetical protein
VREGAVLNVLLNGRFSDVPGSHSVPTKTLSTNTTQSPLNMRKTTGKHSKLGGPPTNSAGCGCRREIASGQNGEFTNQKTHRRLRNHTQFRYGIWVLSTRLWATHHASASVAASAPSHRRPGQEECVRPVTTPSSVFLSIRACRRVVHSRHPRLKHPAPTHHSIGLRKHRRDGGQGANQVTRVRRPRYSERGLALCRHCVCLCVSQLLCTRKHV